MSDLELDYSERTGFLTGKSEAIARWYAKREKAEFAALVNRLRVRKWTKEVRAGGGERLERLRAVKRAYYARNKVALCEAQRIRSRRAPRLKTCDVCGLAFELPYPHPRGGVKKRCSDECERKARNDRERARQSRARRRDGQRETGCTKCGSIGHNRRTCKSEAA